MKMSVIKREYWNRMCEESSRILHAPNNVELRKVGGRCSDYVESRKLEPEEPTEAIF